MNHVFNTTCAPEPERCFIAASPAMLPFVLDKNEAALAGARVARGLRSAVDAVIDACEETYRATQSFDGDRELVDIFLSELEQANIVSSYEARLGSGSPKLSIFNTIGAHASILRRDELRSYIMEVGCSGYTQLHPIVVAYKRFQGSEEEKYQTLLARLREDRPGSRQELIAFSKSAKIKPTLPGTGGDLDGRRQPPDEGFDLVVATPSHSELRRLRDFSTDSLRCLHIHQETARNAVAVVRTRLVDLPIVENKLLPGCGFDFISNVILTRMPSRLDVTTAEVIVVAKRSPGNDVTEFDWLHGDIDLHELASRIAPDAKNKLYLFAPEETDGFFCIVGDANWEPAQ
jgi:hypothetical protein